ncbi:MAG: hypothetical protein WAL84_05585 [Candidatus Dormiibacterota bacterium]
MAICKAGRQKGTSAAVSPPTTQLRSAARDRTLADRRKVRQRGTVTAIVLVCPACGADRLIPLTFPVYQREAGPEVIVVRPMAKCSGCGERIFAKIIARQRIS